MLFCFIVCRTLFSLLFAALGYLYTKMGSIFNFKRAGCSGVLTFGVQLLPRLPNLDGFTLARSLCAFSVSLHGHELSVDRSLSRPRIESVSRCPIRRLIWYYVIKRIDFSGIVVVRAACKPRTVCLYKKVPRRVHLHTKRNFNLVERCNSCFLTF